MSVLPRAFEELIVAFSKLPGVGPRTAERYAYYLYKNMDIGGKLAQDINNLHQNISVCSVTYALIEGNQTVSPLYSSHDRDKATIAVVAEPLDIIAIERTGSYKGTYHVLGGLISPIDGISPEQLKIDELKKRIQTDSVVEIILALNATVEGESTALYIQKKLGDTEVRITRLARGLPVGLDLEYADMITLGRAMEGRTTL